MQTRTAFTWFFAAALFATSFRAEASQTIDVWPGKAPGENGQIEPEKIEQKGPVHLISNVSHPTLTFFPAPKQKNTKAAVMICPGGGYSVLAWDLEGEEVAAWLNSIGVNAVILKYRVPQRPQLPRYLPPLQDAQRALSLIRSKASEWHIDPKRLGMLGFSAGGNLTAVACTQYNGRAYDFIDEIDKQSCRPDFGILIYAAWLNKEKTVELAPEVKVDRDTPQMFLVHATDDPIDCRSSVAMYLALKASDVPAEMHLYASGGHGFGLRPTAKPASTWPARCAQWLRERKLINDSDTP